MECPKCGFVMDAFTVDCPRCKRMQAPTAEVPAAPAPVAPSSSSPAAAGMGIGSLAVIGALGWWLFSSGIIPGGVGRDITYEEYQQITDGMSYAEVCGVIGSDGTEDVSSHMEGVPGVMEDIDTVGYIWQNRDGSNASVMFQNDKMVTKAQAGLD